MKETILKAISNAITMILALVFILMIFFVVSSKAAGGEPQIFGYQLKTVLSGSMEPEFKTGSIIAVEKLKDATSLKKGDVITFMETEDKLITHRIVEVVKNDQTVFYRTKGDNNDTADMNMVDSSNVVATYTGFSVPYIGYFLDFVKTQKGNALLMILPGLLLLGYAAYTILSAVKEIDRNTRKQTELPAGKSI